jgi:hypothetical protein
MINQKNFLRDRHNLGTINEKGANLVLANPLKFKVPGRGIEPRTRGFSVQFFYKAISHHF